MLKHIAPTRYYSEMVDLTFWQALRRFLKHGKWSWQKIYFTPVYKDDPRYEAAPYEEQIVELPVTFLSKPISPFESPYRPPDPPAEST